MMEAAVEEAVSQMARTCPVCHGKKSRELHLQNYVLFDDSSLPTSTALVACERCGTVHATSSATANDYRRHYARHSMYDTAARASGSGETRADAQRLEATVEHLASMIGPKSSVLDIGAGRGGLLAAFRRRGFDDLNGIDPSRGCVDAMRATALPAWICDLEQDAWPTDPRGFDLVLLSHVLEHVFDVADAFENITRRVAAGGAIYIEVPDAARYTVDGFAPFYFFDPEHINHFDAMSLERLAVSHGWSVTDVWSRVLELESGQPYPALGVVLRRSIANAAVPSSTVSEEISRYVTRSSAVASNSPLVSAVEVLASARTPIVVWGAGSHAQRLLAQTALGRCAIDCIIDADSGKQGRRLGGHIVVAPEPGLGRAEAVNATLVVAIAVGADSVVDRLRGLRSKLPVVQL